jgi:hypothetical protein
MPSQLEADIFGFQQELDAVPRRAAILKPNPKVFPGPPSGKS